MAAYAFFEDYAARYAAEPTDEKRITVLLEDASAIIDSMLSGGTAPEALLTSIACAMVNRAMAAADMGGISQYSEGAIGMTASVTYANPNGDLYLTQVEKDALGIGGGMVGLCDLTGGAR